MGNILVFLQQENGKFPKSTLAALTAAKQLSAKWGGDLIGLCLGSSADQAADEAASFGLKEIYVSEDPNFEKYLSGNYVQAVTKAWELGACSVAVAAATTTGKDLMPRAAALLDAGQASDIVAVNDDGSLKRPMYAGDVLADVEINSANRFVTVRATAFDPCVPSGGSAEKKSLDVSIDTSKSGEVISYALSGGDRPELGDAEVVVSGGRAMQSAENFEKYIFPLADAFGAAVGASRAAVDSGYAPNDWQVGQTGKIVAPGLYVAVGISGAIQHLAGMKDSKVIVAINKDPDAPIYDIADYGLVADLYEVVPQLTEAVKQAKS